MTKKDFDPDFWPLESHPDCTHSVVLSYKVAEDAAPEIAGQQVPFWACAQCGVRFEPLTARNKWAEEVK